MTFREKLADWISGGALSCERIKWRDNSNNFAVLLSRKMGDILKLQDALHQIAEQETPIANATVKRMARIAREVLE